MSVRLQLTLWNVGALALALVGLGLGLRFAMQETLMRGIDGQLAQIGQTFQQFAQAVPDFPDDDHPPGPDNGHGPPPPEGGPPPGGMPPQEGKTGTATGGAERHDMHPIWVFKYDGHDRRNPFPGWRRQMRFLGSLNSYSFMIYDLTGEAVGHGPPQERVIYNKRGFAAALAGRTFYAVAAVNGQPSRIYSAPLRRNGRIVAIIQARRSLGDVLVQLHTLERALWMLTPFALLIAGLGGAFLTDRALRPVRSIVRAAEQVEASSLSERLPVVGGGEFAQLSHTFNAMLARLETAFRDLEEANERQRRFVADASHELRTPISIIKANTSLALMSERSPADYRKVLTAVDDAANRTSKIVQDLLLLARADADQLEYPMEPTEIEPVLQRAAAVVHGDQAPKLTVCVAPGLPEVHGNAESLTRLFSNLFDNAARHTPHEGSITATAEVRADQVVVTVVDTGEGIAEEHLPHLLERFYRIDTARSRARGGTGLGLAIVDTIVHAHHGSLKIASELGKGTRVTVSLPMARPLPAPSPSQ